jgi:hypothetical protein
VVETHFQEAEGHILTVKHRLGMVLGADHDHVGAKDELGSIEGELERLLEAGNPMRWVGWCKLEWGTVRVSLRQVL